MQILRAHLDSSLFPLTLIDPQMKTALHAVIYIHFKHVFLFVCCGRWLSILEDGVRSTGTKITDSYRQPYVAAKNWTWSLWKSNKGWELLSHLSRPNFMASLVKEDYNTEICMTCKKSKFCGCLALCSKSVSCTWRRRVCLSHQKEFPRCIEHRAVDYISRNSWVRKKQKQETKNRRQCKVPERRP